MRVAVLGLGRMGTAITERLVQSGHDVTVWNRTPGRADAVTALGAAELSDARDAWRDRDIVISMVADSAALLALTDPDTGLAGAAHGPDAILIDMSTVGADASTIVADRLAAAGIGYLRAPVSGNPAVVRAGGLAILVSGEPDDLERTRSVLEDIGPVVQHVGTGEAARVVKLALNIVIAGTAQLIAESIALAESHGIDRRILLDAMVSSAAGSPLVKYKSAPLVAKDYASTFSSALMHKDLSLAVEAAEEHGVPLTLTTATRLLLQACVSTGLAELDFMALLVNLQRQAGLPPDITP